MLTAFIEARMSGNPWHRLCADLLKGRVPKGFSSDTIRALDEAHGPSPLGDRHETAQWILENGGRTKGLQERIANAIPGTMEHRAKHLISEVQGHTRSASVKKRFMAVHTDSLQGLIDPENLAHHAEAWASYHEHLENKLGGVPDLDVDEYGSARKAPRNEVPIQQRANHIHLRDREVAKAGYAPYHTLEDMSTLKRAVHATADQFTPQELNHFRVMHEAIKLHARSHADTFGDKRSFLPSWSSMEPMALSVAHRAAKSLHHVNDDHARLAGVTGAALAAQEKVQAPRATIRVTSWRQRMTYPALHPKGSELDQMAQSEMAKHYASRGTGERKATPAPIGPPAKPLVHLETLSPSKPANAPANAPASAADDARRLYAEEMAKRKNRKLEPSQHQFVRDSEPEHRPLLNPGLHLPRLSYRTKGAGGDGPLSKALFTEAELRTAAKQSDTDDESLAYPALRLRDGSVITGQGHHMHAALNAMKQGHSKAEVSHALLADPNGTGFVTTKGRYLPRKAAFQMALKQGQIKAGAMEELTRMQSHTLESGDVNFRRSLAARALDCAIEHLETVEKAA